METLHKTSATGAPAKNETHTLWRLCYRDPDKPNFNYCAGFVTNEYGVCILAAPKIHRSIGLNIEQIKSKLNHKHKLEEVGRFDSL